MSTLNVTNAQITTLKDASGNNPTTPSDLVKGRAKAWINYDMSGTAGITESFNITSITDNGTGDCTVTIATDFDDGNYCCVSASGNNHGSGSDGHLVIINDDSAIPTTTAVKCITKNDSNAARDTDRNYLVMFGDQ
jgi:hypothetical protein